VDNLKYAQFEKISLKNHPTLKEAWVQKIIAKNPSILGLGDLILRDKERIQPKAGRLDLLLEETDEDRRYEVEIQLGSTDETHLVRTIEYWDIERRRFPQYDHTAVIVAEDITSRFLNVISLFNGFIPIVALQMSALKHEDSVSLVFTKIIDQMALGTEEEDTPEPTDRAYWEKRGSKISVRMLDGIFLKMKEFATNISLKYNKYYVGISLDGSANNFVNFKLRKKYLLLEIRMDKEDEMAQKLKDEGLDVHDYTRWGKYRLRINEDELETSGELLLDAIQQAYKRAVS
jgi:predicted transport protein